MFRPDRRLAFSDRVIAILLSFVSINLSRVIFLTIPIIYRSHRTVDDGLPRSEKAEQQANG